MNALLRKEIRLILPVWCLALALAVLPVWLLWPGTHGTFVSAPEIPIFAPFVLGVLLLGIAPFGGEINTGMLPNLLAQPVQKERIWSIKIRVLAVALLALFAALCLSHYLRVEVVLEAMKNSVWRNAFSRPGPAPLPFINVMNDVRHGSLEISLVAGALACLAAFGGGLWTTLLFRHVTAAFWCAVLVPAGLTLLSLKVFGGLNAGATHAMLMLVIAGYCTTTFLWARRLFARAQDVDWTSPVVSFSRGTAPQEASGYTGLRRTPVRTLLGNEFVSQQINAIIAAGFLVVHLLVLLFRALSPEYLAGHTTLALALESFPVAWLLMPLLIGSVAIAEERRLGTLENLFCLAVTRRTEFLVKLSVALLLGALFGSVLPGIVEQLGPVLGLRQHSTGLSIGPWMLAAGSIPAGPSVSLPAALIFTLLAFYGSSLARNTFQAMAIGAGLIITAVTLAIVLSGPPAIPGIYLWGSRVLFDYAVPVMGASFLVLAFGNFRHLQVEAQSCVRNAVVLALALVFSISAASFTFNRVWEAWLPEEPAHVARTALFTGQNYATVRLGPPGSAHRTDPKIANSDARTAVLLPNGRIWMRERELKEIARPAWNPSIRITKAVGPEREGFVPGNDWVDLLLTESSAFALKSDGKLWNIAGALALGPGERGVKDAGFTNLWKQVACAGGHYVGLQKDGTLWEWGHKLNPTADKPFAVTNYTSPHQLGTDRDWVAICDSYEMSVAAKADQSVWHWRSAGWPQDAWARTNRLAAEPVPWLRAPARPARMAFNGNTLVFTTKDGELWVAGRTLGSYSQGPEAIRIGGDSHWSQACVSGWRLIGLSSTGVLKEWEPLGAWPAFSNPSAGANELSLSEYSDWLAIAPYNNSYAFLALAADGSLYLWGDPHFTGWNMSYGPDPQRVLMPSRIKAHRLAQILK